MSQTESSVPVVERQSMDVDVVCVGFGPATGGFLTTLSKAMTEQDGKPVLESKVMPGLPLQVLCYERADGLDFGVSGVVSLARGIRASFPELDPSQIPLATPVKTEKTVYLLDPIGASRRPWNVKLADFFIRLTRFLPFYKDEALELPYTPPFLRKHGGLLMSIGQFNQWVATRLMSDGKVQIWPGMPVESPLIENERVTGVRLVDQGTDKQGKPEAGYMPGMDVKAAMTVIGDGPVGPIGRKLDEKFGLPLSHLRRDWAVGVKFLVNLPEGCNLEPGTVIHTMGFPEMEIFGFLYVYADRSAAMGIFVPSWFDSPVRTAYRYLQHWMRHPYIWKHLQGGSLRSFGAKTLFESGQHGEPQLVGDGWARIGEGSGSTNVLSGSGVDEAWTTGVQLAEGVAELWRSGKPFTKENLEKAYVERRRNSWVEKEAKIAANARNGFHRGFVAGVLGMAAAGMTKGKLHWSYRTPPPAKRIQSLETYYRDRIVPEELKKIREECAKKNVSLHDAVMDKLGWPAIPYDGKLLVSHQDALLLGGKVQAAGGYCDHVVFADRDACRNCGEMVCVEMCSGQAITRGEDGPAFDREKCVHCGACLWNCSKPRQDDPEKGLVDFNAGSGGLHSAEN
jgi:electron-transferring-flavoprotein dehydrogenase